jgi:hypothetical protein
VSGRAYTAAKVKRGRTIPFAVSTRTDLLTKRSTYFQLDVAWSFRTAAKSGSRALVLSNSKQNVRCYGESTVLSYYRDLGSYFNS